LLLGSTTTFGKIWIMGFFSQPRNNELRSMKKCQYPTENRKINYRHLFFFITTILPISTYAQTPTFEWAKKVGGTNIDRAVSIAVDDGGNTYTTGRFSGAADFDPGPGTFSISSLGGNDVFITKLDASGNFVWAKRIGGPNNEETLSIALDVSGNIYVTGIFNGTTDFDPGASVFNLTRLGGVDVFICKLDSDGNFIWAKQFGGNDLNYVRSVVVDGAGNVLTTGEFEGTTDFDPGVSVFNLSTLPSDVNAFICKLNSDGDFVWAKQFVGNALDQGYSIATDNSNHVYTTGLFELTTDFDPGPGVFNLTSAGDHDCFISKLDVDGNFVWAKRIGGTGRDAGYALAIDAAGNVLTTGFFGFLGTTADFDPGAGNFILTSAGSADIFISKLDNSGNFIWAKQMGGTGNDLSYSIVLDDADNPIITGQFQGTADFDPDSGTFNLVSGSSSNIYLSQLDAAGNFDWAIAFVSTSSGVGRGLVIDNSNNIYSTGIFSGTFDFDPGVTLFNLTSFGSDDAWIHKLRQQPTGIPSITSFTPTSGPIGTTVTITGSNFSTTPANNIVYFGATKATVTSATSTQLTTTVPAGATYQPITVSVSGLTAQSHLPFVVTFVGGGSFDNCSFAPAIALGTTAGFTRSAFADIDGDGKPDLLVPYSNDDVFAIFRNISTIGSIASTSFEPKIDFTTGDSPFGIATGDLDGDGKPDIAVINYRGGQLSIYKNLSTPGNILLATKVDFTIPDFGHDVWIADVDSDGKQDLTITTSLAGMTVLRNTTITGVINASSFAPGITFATGPNPNPFALGDMDGDGKLDAAIPNANAFSVSLLRNTSTSGTISFAPQVLLPITTGSPVPGAGSFFTTLGDIDDDGKLDLVVTTNTINAISLFRNTSALGTFSFDPQVDLSVGEPLNKPVLSDLDGDGKTDLVADFSSTGNLVYKNQATPGSINASTFSTPTTFPKLPSRSILLGDVDGDGQNDIITTSATIQILKNLIGTIDAPVITSFSPLSGSEGTTVTINGNNFNTLFATAVEFNGIPATIQSRTANTIVVLVPLGATTGPIEVTVGCNTIVSSGNFIVGAATITITTQPTDFTACVGQTATFTTAATGTTNITYQWQFSTTLAGIYIDITNSSGYSNVSTASVSVNTTGNFGAGFYRCRITGDLAAANFSNPAQLIINAIPTSPSVTGGVNCGAGSVTLSASGGVAGQYRWYTVATGGTALAGETNDTYTTPVLSTSTDYFVAINNGTCESTRTSVTVTFNSLPTAPTAGAVSICGGSTATLTASGGTAGQYRWYTVATGGTALAGETNDTFTTPVLSASTDYFVAINNGTCESTRTSVTVTFNSLPTAPTAGAVSICGGSTATLIASGGTDGQYRWYTAATGGSPITGEVNNSFITPFLTTTTSYFVSINDGLCESNRTSVTATINPLPSIPIVTSSIAPVGNALTICSTTALTLTAPVGFASYNWSTGATTQQISVSTTGNYSVTVTDASACKSPPSDVLVVTVVPASCNNQPPVISTTSTSTTIGGVATINLIDFISDADNNIVLSSLAIIQQPPSGAAATITNGVLEINYQGVSFSGRDQVTIQVCDDFGECTQQVLEIEVIGDIEIFNGLSPNNDGLNDIFLIQYIDLLPDTQENKVYIYNRWGSKVFEVRNYNNTTNVFRGLNDNGNELPSGTYFYKIEFTGPYKRPTQKGYLSLKR